MSPVSIWCPAAFTYTAKVDYAAGGVYLASVLSTYSGSFIAYDPALREFQITTLLLSFVNNYKVTVTGASNGFTLDLVFNLNLLDGCLLALYSC